MIKFGGNSEDISNKIFLIIPIISNENYNKTNELKQNNEPVSELLRLILRYSYQSHEQSFRFFISTNRITKPGLL